MVAWERLARFVAVEDDQIHYGQPVDANQDVGLSAYRGEVIKLHDVPAIDIRKPPFDAQVNESQVLTLKEVRRYW